MRIVLALLAVTLLASAQNVRLTKDAAGGYVSAYTLATGIAYTDSVISECGISRGRQNEPAVAVNPRDTRVIVGSSNDYCGTYAGSTTVFSATGPIWLGYYRSENGGTSFVSSLVPGYPGDTSPYAALAKIRTASSGDPVIAWDGHGRVFFGSESSDDPAGTKKSFGDQWVSRYDNPGGEGGNTLNDGKRYRGTTLVDKGVSAPNYNGKFNDKTAIEADRTGGACDGNVYFAWSRFNGLGGGSNIYFSRSTDHGETWSQPINLTPNTKNVQFPDISVTGNGHVYVTIGQGATNSGQPDAVVAAKSADCGRTFSKPVVAATFVPYVAEDRTLSGGSARDCGDLDSACQSGYTFFRRDASPRSTADQSDDAHEYIYIVYDAIKPGTGVATGTTYGANGSGNGGQSAAYFLRYDGANGSATTPALIDAQAAGHQVFPDISVDHGKVHVIWWDSRNDPSYSPARPIGNDASGHVGPSLDVWYAKSTNRGDTWTNNQRITSVTSNPNYNQFSNRTVPFAGDYLWVSSVGEFAFAAWTDWRDVVAGPDPRVPPSTAGTVKQCRTQDPVTGVWSTDQCPRDGGIDQNIYGVALPPI